MIIVGLRWSCSRFRSHLTNERLHLACVTIVSQRSSDSHLIVPAAHVQVLITACPYVPYIHALPLPTVLTVLTRHLARSLTITHCSSQHLNRLTFSSHPISSRLESPIGRVSLAAPPFRRVKTRRQSSRPVFAGHLADRPSPFAHQFSCLSLLSPPA
jgi:hypothetical protein